MRLAKVVVFGVLRKNARNRDGRSSQVKFAILMRTEQLKFERQISALSEEQYPKNDVWQSARMRSVVAKHSRDIVRDFQTRSYKNSRDTATFNLPSGAGFI